MHTPVAGPDEWWFMVVGSFDDLCPDLRPEWWRLWSYQLVHAGWMHVVGNLSVQLLFGIPVNVVNALALVPNPSIICFCTQRLYQLGCFSSLIGGRIPLVLIDLQFERLHLLMPISVIENTSSSSSWRYATGAWQRQNSLAISAEHCGQRALVRGSRRQSEEPCGLLGWRVLLVGRSHERNSVLLPARPATRPRRGLEASPVPWALACGRCCGHCLSVRGQCRRQQQQRRSGFSVAGTRWRLYNWLARQ